MVKFGKYIEMNIRPEWKDYYIDYKLLKTFLKQLKLIQDKEINESYPIIHLKKEEEEKLMKLITEYGLADHLEDEIKNKTPIEQELIKKKYIFIGKHVNEFLHKIDEEVQKFNDFYLNLEKRLRKEFYDLKLNLEELHHIKNVKEVLRIVDDMDIMADKIISICQYININITAIRKILKKFDKKFDTKDNPVALHYLKKNLTRTNSSLVYILQFKIIDEASAILDKMMESLEKSFFKETSKITESLLQEPLLLKEINLDEISGHDIDKNINKMIRKKFNKIKQKLEKIDDSNSLIRSGIEVWSLIIKSNMRVVNDYFKSKMMIERMNKEKMQEILLGKLTPQLHREEEYHMSFTTKMNIYIVLSHTFIYTMNCYIVQPTNGLYVAELGASKTYSGLIMGLTHLAAIFCTFIYSYMTNFSYKFPLLISGLLFILGNFFYSFAEYHQSLFIMGLGRFLIGLASARVVNRRYIIDQIPQQLIMFFSLLYVGLTCLGMAAGPFIALILLEYFPNEYILGGTLKFNNLTNPGWFCLIIWVLFTLIVLIIFKDPENEENNTGTNKNTNQSSTNLTEVKISENPNEIKDKNALTNTSSSNQDFEHDIQQMIHEQETTYSYMNIAFTILLIILLIIRMTTESLMVLTPISTPIHFGISPKFIAWFLTFTAAIVFPITYMLNSLDKKYHERQIIFTLLILCTISCLFIINIPYAEVSLVRFMFFYTILFVSCNILESIVSALLAKIFPSNLHLGLCNSGFTIILTTTGGKFIGSFLITILGWFLYEGGVYDFLISFYLVAFLVLCVLVYFNYSDLRVKAIARILQKHEN